MKSRECYKVIGNRWFCNTPFIAGRIGPVECVSEFLNREMSMHERMYKYHIVFTPKISLQKYFERSNI